MVLITVFDLESDESVKRIKNGFLTILRRYLQEHGLNDVDYDMQNIINCITALPRVYKLFKEMSREPEEKIYHWATEIECIICKTMAESMQPCEGNIVGNIVRW